MGAFKDAKARIAAGDLHMDGSIPATLIYMANAQGNHLEAQARGEQPMFLPDMPINKRLPLCLEKLETNVLSGWARQTDGSYEKSFATSGQRALAQSMLALLAQQGNKPPPHPSQLQFIDEPSATGHHTQGIRCRLRADATLIEPILRSEDMLLERGMA